MASSHLSRKRSVPEDDEPEFVTSLPTPKKVKASPLSEQPEALSSESAPVAEEERPKEEDKDQQVESPTSEETGALSNESTLVAGDERPKMVDAGQQTVNQEDSETCQHMPICDSVAQSVASVQKDFEFLQKQFNRMADERAIEKAELAELLSQKPVPRMTVRRHGKTLKLPDRQLSLLNMRLKIRLSQLERNASEHKQEKDTAKLKEANEKLRDEKLEADKKAAAANEELDELKKKVKDAEILWEVQQEAAE